MAELMPLLIDGTWMTIRITVLAAALAVVLAVPAALARMAPQRSLRWIGTVYIEVFRGTSLLANGPAAVALVKEIQPMFAP